MAASTKPLHLPLKVREELRVFGGLLRHNAAELEADAGDPEAERIRLGEDRLTTAARQRRRADDINKAIHDYA